MTRRNKLKMMMVCVVLSPVIGLASAWLDYQGDYDPAGDSSWNIIQGGPRTDLFAHNSVGGVYHLNWGAGTSPAGQCNWYFFNKNGVMQTGQDQWEARWTVQLDTASFTSTTSEYQGPMVDIFSYSTTPGSGYRTIVSLGEMFGGANPANADCLTLYTGSGLVRVDDIAGLNIYAMNTYKIAAKGAGAFDLYLNNAPTPIYSGTMASTSDARLGSVWCGFQTGWDDENGLMQMNVDSLVIVPEPASLSLFTLGIIGLLRRK